VSKLRHLARRILSNFDEVDIVYRVIGDPPGTMLDVGAHQGSSMIRFLECGWTVYGFEPDPSNRRILEARCPSATIDPRAVSEEDGAEVPLFTSDVSTGISTLSPFHSTHAPVATVKTVRLDTYIHEHNIDTVDFLKTDIEGFDFFALRTFPWSTHHPKAVVCEFEDNKTVRLGHDMHDVAKFLQGQGYSVLVSEWAPIVEYGRHHRWRRLMRYPADVPDGSWGNLIAVEPRLLSQVEKTGRSAAALMPMHRLATYVRKIS
jgi:FkbM family methyltransferase